MDYAALPRSPRVPRARWFVVGILPLIASAAAGFALAAATVSPVTGETSGGLYHSVTNLAYWTESSFVVTTIPSSGTSTLTTNKNFPTVLSSSSASYTLGTVTAGDRALEFSFTEAHSAPTNTEIKLVLTYAIGQTPATTTLTGFPETQSTPPSGSPSFNVFIDTSGSTAGTVVIASVTAQASQCASVGSC
jgi:hypothetical protein